MTSSGRDRVALQPPAADLSTFPHKTVSKGRRWWRNHGPLGPWYFDSSSEGRFNLDDPYGTLYLATSRECAVRERIGFDMADAGYVTAWLVDGRQVSELELPVDVRAARATGADCLRWGLVAGELTNVDDFSLTRSWARAFHAAGFGGMWTMLRFSGAHGRGLSVFGDKGPRDWGKPITSMSMRAAVRSMHLTVLDPPPSTGLTII